MAFSTELVLAAQTGPGVEMITQALGTTSSSQSVTLPAGTWFCALHTNSMSFTSSTAGNKIIIDGVSTGLRSASQGSARAEADPFTGINPSVNGGRSITVSGPSGAKTFYAARIG